MLLGFVGVLIFSLTLPATRVAVTHLDPLFIGLGRSLVAAVFAAVFLLAIRAPFGPHASARDWHSVCTARLDSV